MRYTLYVILYGFNVDLTLTHGGGKVIACQTSGSLERRRDGALRARPRLGSEEQVEVQLGKRRLAMGGRVV